MVVVRVIARRMVVIGIIGWMFVLRIVVMFVVTMMACHVGMLEPDESCFSRKRTKHHGKHEQPCGEGGGYAGWFCQAHDGKITVLAVDAGDGDFLGWVCQ